MHINDILYLPIDIPPIPREITLENVINFYNNVPRYSKEEKEELARNKQFYKYVWNSYRLREIAGSSAKWENQYEQEQWQWTDNAKENCPLLIEYIDTYLPFKNLQAASIMSATGIVPPHYDMSPSMPEDIKQSFIANDPTMYRILIDGTIKENTFYVARKNFKEYIRVPKDAYGWVMGSFSCVHGNDEDLSHQKIILYLIGEVDSERHISLINRSMEKYKDYAILKKDS